MGCNGQGQAGEKFEILIDYNLIYYIYCSTVVLILFYPR